jgi:RimJ/RimL family protein N-acetyltransferase
VLSLEISTPRLALRPALPTDSRAITALVADPRIHRNVGRIAPGQSQDETRDFLECAKQGHFAGTDHVCVVERKGELIGCVGVRRQTTRDLFELGYWIAPEAWGQGYATEAAKALMDRLQARAGVKVMMSGHFADNLASGRVLRKLGFLPCGRRPYHCLGRDETVDHRDMVWVA